MGCTVHACLLNSDTDVYVKYVVHNENAKKGQNTQKSTEVCRTGTPSTKLQLFVLFVIMKEWKDVCLLLV